MNLALNCRSLRCVLNFHQKGDYLDILDLTIFYQTFLGAEAQDVFELPPEMANPQKTPCVNVPEWFVKEGGELCLSDTKNGLSIIRYWPKFLSERGNALMFKRLRKYCKWHQKQVKLKKSNIYSHGHLLTYGYLISSMKMRSL